VRLFRVFLTPVVQSGRRKTIIAGHSVENDLLALRLFHKRVIGTPRRVHSDLLFDAWLWSKRMAVCPWGGADTTMHFPHANGPPFKNSLRYLTEKFLKRLIQQGGCPTLF
jgi:RNA exonuclease 1